MTIIELIGLKTNEIVYRNRVYKLIRLVNLYDELDIATRERVKRWKPKDLITHLKKELANEQKNIKR